MRISDIVAVCFLIAAPERLTTFAAPTPVPTRTPTLKPSKLPTSSPSQPTSRPSSYPTSRPTSSKPSLYPTTAPFRPSKAPFKYPTLSPIQPTSRPSGLPSGQPTAQPTGHPSLTRTYSPTVSPQPTGQPSAYPSSTPTSLPTSNPTMSPTISSEPTGQPSSQPSSQPSAQPSGQPTTSPTDSKPTGQPSGQPTRAPSRPTGQPTAQPSRQPTSQPTRQPTGQPTAQPSRQPTGQPTSKPSIPTGQPTTQPSAQPSSMPTLAPVIAIPSGQPTSSPSGEPSGQPSSSPTAQPSVSPRPTSNPTGMPSGQPSSQPTQFDATVRPTGKYARSVATGVVKLDPLNADFCIPVQLDIEISFTTVVSSGDYFTLHTPGLTSGACSYPTNGASITSLALFNSSLVSASYTEGDRLTNYQTSMIKFTAKEDFMAGELYHFLIDRSNRLKRTCVHNTSWTVYMEHASLQGSLTFEDSHPTECFSYNSSLSFFPPHPQLSIGINFTFLLPFSLNLGDSITLLLPGFSNKIADYPLNGMISGANNTESYVIGAGSDAQLVNITQQYNTTTLLWSTPFGWKGRWIEGSLATGNDSQLILYPQGLDPLNRAVWVVIDGYENHLVSLVGRQMNYSGFKMDVRGAHFTVNQSSVTTSTAIGSGCNELDGCNGNGNCDYEKSSCDCFDGFGSASDLKNTYLNNFAPDCSGRSCPKGPAYVALPRLVSQGYHQLVECANNGICSRITGNCTCFNGFNGVACEKMGCPGSPMCSGRGLCYSMGQLPAVPTAVPLRPAAATDVQYLNQVNATSNSTIWDADRGHACVCDSSWAVGLGANQTQQAEYFGPACELRHCPSGNDPGTANDETNCTGVIPAGGRVAGLEGNKCQVDCSNRGICDYSTGVCACFNGYTGVACNGYSKGVRISLI